jgi:hypothetical protein
MPFLYQRGVGKNANWSWGLLLNTFKKWSVIVNLKYVPAIIWPGQVPVKVPVNGLGMSN